MRTTSVARCSAVYVGGRTSLMVFLPWREAMVVDPGTDGWRNETGAGAVSMVPPMFTGKVPFVGRMVSYTHPARRTTRS